MSIMRIYLSKSPTQVDGFQLTKVDAFKYVFNEKGLFSGLCAFFVGRKVTIAEVENHARNDTSSIYSKLIVLLEDRDIESCSTDFQTWVKAKKVEIRENEAKKKAMKKFMRYNDKRMWKNMRRGPLTGFVYL